MVAHAYKKFGQKHFMTGALKINITVKYLSAKMFRFSLKHETFTKEVGT